MPRSVKTFFAYRATFSTINADISVYKYLLQLQNLRDITSPLFMVSMRIELATCVVLTQKIQLI